MSELVDHDLPSASGGSRWFDLSRIPAVLIALAASVALTAALWFGTSADVIGSAGFQAVGDDHVYVYMAKHPLGSFHIAPWCWRILVPVIVSHLPLSLEQGFESVTLLTTALTGLVVYVILRKLCFSNGLSMLGLMLFFSMSYATRFNLRDFWLTDTTAFLFTALALLALLHRRLTLYVLCLVVGVLAKESVIFVTPLCYTFTARQRWDLGALARTVLLAAPAVAELILLRQAISAWNGHVGYVAALPSNVRSDIGNVASYNLLTVAGKEISARWQIWPQDLVQVITSFGTLGLVLPLLGGWRNLLSTLTRFWPFLILVYSQLLFTFNTQRLIVLAFIPVTFAAMLGIRRVTERFEIPTWFFPLTLTAGVAIELVSRTASSPSPAPQVAVFGAMAVLAGLYHYLRRRREPADRLDHSSDLSLPGASDGSLNENIKPVT